MEKLSYIVHQPGHKNSKGQSAPWVVKQHSSGKTLGSYRSKAAAEKALKRMRYFKHKGNMENENLLKSSLLKLASAQAIVPVGYEITDEQIISYVHGVSSWEEKLQSGDISDEDWKSLLKDIVAWQIQKGITPFIHYARSPQSEFVVDNDQKRKVIQMFKNIPPTHGTTASLKKSSELDPELKSTLARLPAEFVAFMLSEEASGAIPKGALLNALKDDFNGVVENFVHMSVRPNPGYPQEINKMLETNMDEIRTFIRPRMYAVLHEYMMKNKLGGHADLNTSLEKVAEDNFVHYKMDLGNGPKAWCKYDDAEAKNENDKLSIEPSEVTCPQCQNMMEVARRTIADEIK